MLTKEDMFRIVREQINGTTLKLFEYNHLQELTALTPEAEQLVRAVELAVKQPDTPMLVGGLRTGATTLVAEVERLTNQVQFLRSVRPTARRMAELQTALEACQPYLKNGETPAERIQREIADCAAVTELLTKEKGMTEWLLTVLAGLVEDIRCLMSESDGVCGLHLNGDVATWDELEPGGKFERLTRLADAEATLAGVKS